jgi:hypothetical protein
MAGLDYIIEIARKAVVRHTVRLPERQFDANAGVDKCLSSGIFDSHHVDVPIWKREPYKLVNLMAIMEFQVHVYCNIFASLAEQAAIYKESSALLDSSMLKSLIHFIDASYTACKQTNLPYCSKYLENRKVEYTNRFPSFSEVALMFRGLQERMSEEMSSNLFLYVEPKRADYYKEQYLFGREVTEKFPSAIFDIEEAGKCFALARYTASVMHLMRVIEIGMRAVAQGLEIQAAELLPTWQAVISKIESQMKIAANKRSPDWLKIEPFYREIPAHLFAIKNAWRNPSMHVQTSYDEERALDIFNAVKGFMRYLATKLAE